MNVLSFLNPWRRNRLETYVLQSYISMFGAALLVIASMILLIDYVSISKTISSRADLSSLSIFGLLLEKSPNSILVLLPFAFLFGSLLAFINLNRRSELIAMRAAGVSAWRFVLPAAALAFMVGILTITVLSPVASLLNDRYDQRIHQIDADDPTLNSKVIYLRQGDGNSQVVIRADSQDKAMASHLYGVTFWTYTIDKSEVPVFITRIDAREATLLPGQWALRGAREAKPATPTRTYETLSIPSNLDPKDAFRKYVSTSSVPFWRLPALIHQNAISGFATTAYELKLQQLLATPLMFAAMSVLGAAFSLRLMRLGGLTRLVISGVSLGFVIFFVNQLFSSMGKASVIPVILAGWTPAVLAILAAMSLLVYTEDG